MGVIELSMIPWTATALDADTQRGDANPGIKDRVRTYEIARMILSEGNPSSRHWL